MKNIPVFTTEYGTATLVLKEIPYRSLAYVIAQSVLPGGLEPLAAECLSFCRAAGAERVFLSAPGGGDCPWPEHTRILEMRSSRERIGQTEAFLFPVLPELAGQYRERYNRAMASVDNAATMERQDEAEFLQTGGGYFVHDGKKLLGLGQIVDGELRAVAAVEGGRGADVVRALCGAGDFDTISLQVASTNERALRLYTRLGFLPVGEVSRWHRLWG